jgi:hypothetical protein
VAPLSAQKGGKKAVGPVPAPAPAPATAPVTAGAELRVSKETTNPGGIAQIKLSLTEPKPISTGYYDFSGGYDLMGISLFDPANATYGLAWFAAGGLRVVTSSPLSTFGMSNPDYPILTLTVRVPAAARLGSVLPVHLDGAALRLVDPAGNPYPTKVTDGSIAVQTTAAVEDVIPGSDVVEAGGTIRILGRNLSSDMKISVDEVTARQTLVVSPSEIDIVVGAPTVMHARGIHYRTKFGRADYYSYQRTHDASSSVYPVLNTLEPLFPGTDSEDVSLALPAAAADEIQAILVQNSHLEPVFVTFSRLTTTGEIEQANPIEIPAASRLALGVSEIFGSACAGACAVNITATDAIHAMGVVVDPAMTRVRVVAP